MFYSVNYVKKKVKRSVELKIFLKVLNYESLDEARCKLSEFMNELTFEKKNVSFDEFLSITERITRSLQKQEKKRQLLPEWKKIRLNSVSNKVTLFFPDKKEDVNQKKLIRDLETALGRINSELTFNDLQLLTWRILVLFQLIASESISKWEKIRCKLLGNKLIEELSVENGIITLHHSLERMIYDPTLTFNDFLLITERVAKLTSMCQEINNVLLQSLVDKIVASIPDEDPYVKPEMLISDLQNSLHKIIDRLDFASISLVTKRISEALLNLGGVNLMERWEDIQHAPETMII